MNYGIDKTGLWIQTVRPEHPISRVTTWLEIDWGAAGVYVYSFLFGDRVVPVS